MIDSGEHGTVKRVSSDGQSILPPKSVEKALVPPAPGDTLSKAASLSASVSVSAGEEESSLIGKTIDRRFRIVSRLGKGGMSEVYKAEHVILQQMVAVKVLHQEQAAKENAVERFQQEARAISSLDHPNIVKVSAFGISEEKKLYLAMDYLDGPRFSDLLETEGHLSWERALEIGLQISDGLAHAHSRGIIHRDLKPSNIIVQTNERGKEFPKIVDFGIARLTSESGLEAKQLTLEGNTCGSPPYMSPEQCLGEPVDHRSDIYSFGCMMYELLCAKRPFTANSAMELMQKHVTQSPKFFKTIAPKLEIPQSLEAIIRKCLAKKAEDRYQKMEDLHADLQIVGSDSSAESVLRKNFKQETAGDGAARAKVLRAKLIVALGLVILTAVAGYLAYELLPQGKIFILKSEIEKIPSNDPQRIEKLFVLVPQLMELDIKAGDRDAAFLQVLALDKELHKLPLSTARFQTQTKVVGLYNRLGRTAEAQALANQIVSGLTDYVNVCNRQLKFNEMESAAFLVLRLCRNDTQKQDHVLGQFNLLIPMCVWRKQYPQAERMAKEALEIVQSRTQQKGDADEISALFNLANTLMPQGKLKEAEETLQRAWELCEKSWTHESPLARSVGSKLVECYRAEGKFDEAKRIANLIK